MVICPLSIAFMNLYVRSASASAQFSIPGLEVLSAQLFGYLKNVNLHFWVNFPTLYYVQPFRPLHLSKCDLISQANYVEYDFKSEVFRGFDIRIVVRSNVLPSWLPNKLLFFETFSAQHILWERKSTREDPSVGGNVYNKIGHSL